MMEGFTGCEEVSHQEFDDIAHEVGLKKFKPEKN